MSNENELKNELGYEVQEPFKTLEPGTYDAVIHAIINQGIHNYSYQEQDKGNFTLIKVVYEIPNQLRGDGKTQVIGQNLRLPKQALNSKYSEKNNFVKLLKALLGNNIKEEVSKKLLESLLEKVCSITLESFDKPDNSGQGIKVASVHALDPRLPQPTPVRNSFVFNPFDDTEETLLLFEHDLTDTTREKIMSALNSHLYPESLHKFYKELKDKKNKVGSDIDPEKFNTAAIQ